MDRKTLQDELRVLRSQGKTTIKLTSKNSELQAEYDRITKEPSTKQDNKKAITWEEVEVVCPNYNKAHPLLTKGNLSRACFYPDAGAILHIANHILITKKRIPSHYGLLHKLPGLKDSVNGLNDHHILMATEIAEVFAKLKGVILEDFKDFDPVVDEKKNGINTKSKIEKIKFVTYFENLSAQICREVVRHKGKLDKIAIIAINTPFEFKEEISTWCKEREGSWHPVMRYWWVPLKKEYIPELRELSFFEGKFHCPDEKAKDIVLAYYSKNELPPEKDGILYNTFSVFPEQEKYYNTYDEFVDFEFDDQKEYNPQMQGWVLIKGKSIRVVMFIENPGSVDDQTGLFYCPPKLFVDEQGKEWWTMPWVNPLDKFTWPSWPNEEIIGSEVLEEPIPEKPPIMTIKAIMKNIKDTPVCIGVRCQIQKGLNTHEWSVALGWCKSKPGRKWNENKKAWDIFWSDDLAQALDREIAANKEESEFYFDISSRAIEEVNRIKAYFTGVDFNTVWSEGCYFTEGFENFLGANT